LRKFNRDMAFTTDVHPFISVYEETGKEKWSKQATL